MDNRKYIDQIRYQGKISDRSYLQQLPLVQYLERVKSLDFHQPVTFLVGENGSGKSTLIEAIAVNAGFNGEGGSKSVNFSTRNTVSQLSESISIVKSAFPKDGYFLRAESFYNVASYIDDVDVTGYGDRSLHQQSHGESFLALVQNRFRGNGLYLLDEPEAALSPSRQMTLMIEMHNLVKMNSQFIIATHSPILLAYPHATIYEFHADGIRQVTYRESDHYNVYASFMERPEQMVKYLLDDDG